DMVTMAAPPRAGSARLHACRAAGRHHNHRADHGHRRPARAQLSHGIQGESREDPDRELQQRTRPVLPRYRSLSVRLGGAPGAGRLGRLEKRPDTTAARNAPHLRAGLPPADPWGNPYVYRSPGQEGRTYEILSYGADGTEGGTGSGQDITSWQR